MFRWAGLLLLGWVSLAAGCSREKQPAPASVTIRGMTWQVELAINPRQRYRGLSGRTEMPHGRGMLFLFPDSAVRDFCMRQCLIDLDIAFIGPDRRVIKTQTMRVEPDGLGRVPYSSDAPAQFVLEVQAGALQAAGVQAGDRVEFSSGVPGPAKAQPDE
jgi:uncharacterized membrane protein (UPF0127 family)